MTGERARPVRVGTSGWHYPHWRGPFYPRDLAKPDWLAFYAQRLSAVEVNSSFYGFPSETSVRNWLDSVPPHFRFALKASSYITHRKKLKDCAEALARFLAWAELFGGRLGPILFQLPPHWHLNAERLARFLGLLPDGLEFAFEFRDLSWHAPAVYDLLAARRAAFCQFELAGLATPGVVTSDLVYIRLHGPGELAYRGGYPDEALAPWVRRVDRWVAEGRRVWLFFDNDEAGHAALDALRLSARLASAGISRRR
jgi:uncharacterized protein YecE (DUF72 family)